MAKMTPLEYAKKFFELDVFLYPPELDPKDGKPVYEPPAGWRTLKADNYRNPKWAKSNWGPNFWHDIAKHFNKKQWIAVTVKPIAGPAEEVQLNSMQAHNYYRHAFSGKASPELMQIAIQLVYRFRPVKLTVERFVDLDFVGTDCNGFVGGYYQRVVKGQNWQVADPSRGPGPDSFVGTLFKLGKEVLNPKDLAPADTHILVYCRRDGTIIENNAQDAFAHILLTVPNTLNGQAGAMTVQAVESYPPELRHVTYTIKDFKEAKVGGRSAGMFRLSGVKVDQWARMSRLDV